MKRTREKKLQKLTVLLMVTALLATSFSGCAGCNKNDTPVVATPTTAVTATVAPTPTEEAVPTVAPALPTPVPATPTPLPTPTPAPTSTPVPTIAVAEDAKLLGTAKMGDNVFYDLYDDGTLVVRGTGATMDFKNGMGMSDYYKKQHAFSGNYLNELVTTIIIEEGVTEIGKSALGDFFLVTKVVFPKSLKKIGGKAFSGVGYQADSTEYIGLVVEGAEIASTAFWACRNPEKIPNGEKYTATPTPTPAPTATPVPDPDKPRMYASKQMGDNVTFEFYDNGILYVKGEGASWDKDHTFVEFMKEPYCNTHTVIVEDGITYLGDHVFFFMWDITYYRLPKSLTDAGITAAGGKDVVIEGYLDGNAVTLKAKQFASLCEFFDAPEAIELGYVDGYELIYH